MKRNHLKVSSKGFSLVEISIVLVIIGILAFFSIKFISQIGSQALNVKFKNDLERADHALTGFIFANNRLPCPDMDGDGDEDCAIGIKQGFLPIETLGIESSIQKKRGGSIRYAVYREANASLKDDMDLASSKDRYEPLLPNSETSAQTNGLDFCLSLKSGSLAVSVFDASQVNIGSNGINVAYAMADSGTINADNIGDMFDGTNGSGVRFEQPNKPHLNNYDDNVLAIGFNELSGRLNCPKVLAETNGEARASYAAYDMWLVATQYKLFRDFNVDYLRSMLQVAETSRDLAYAGVALALMSVAVGAADLALQPAATVAAAIGIALAAAATVDAAFALKSALEAVVDANKAIVDAQLQQTQANASLNKALLFKNRKLTSVKALDERGLIR